jgi:hypothetical protein
LQFLRCLGQSSCPGDRCEGPDIVQIQSLGHRQF